MAGLAAAGGERDWTALTSVDRGTVHRRVHAQLRGLLMRGHFQPGQTLTILELAAAFGTSVQPVREAIRQLTGEQALEALPNRMTRVPLLDLDRLEDLRRARLAIEGLVAELAAANATRADVEVLERLVAEANAADDDHRAEDSVGHNLAFHFTLYRLSGSAVLPPLIESLWLQVGPYIRGAAERFDGRRGRGAEFHHEAVDALRRGDPQGVRRAIEADIDRFFGLAREFVAAQANAA